MRPEFAHLGLFVPVRNGTDATDYVKEFIRLKTWARDKHGQHSQRDKDRNIVPRLRFNEARTMHEWWAEAASDIDRDNQIGRIVNHAVAHMKGIASSSKSGELSFEQAAAFWNDMRELAINLRPAKEQPGTLDKLQMLAESYGESVTELPGRLLDAVEMGVELAKNAKKMAENASEGMDKLITGLKWTGIIGGGLAGLFLITRLVPERNSNPA